MVVSSPLTARFLWPSIYTRFSFLGWRSSRKIQHSNLNIKKKETTVALKTRLWAQCRDSFDNHIRAFVRRSLSKIITVYEVTYNVTKINQEWCMFKSTIHTSKITVHSQTITVLNWGAASDRQGPLKSVYFRWVHSDLWPHQQSTMSLNIRSTYFSAAWEFNQ